MKTLVAALIVLMAAPAFGDTPKDGAELADEYEIKAAMYVNLLRLVDWPSAKRGDPASPLVIGVSGSDDMARALEAISQSKNIPASKRITVKRISGAAGVAECHSLFIGGEDRKKILATLQSLGTSPVLTVGENDRFVGLGGMIDLTLKDDRVQIEVNLDAVKSGGLTISSQLLKIAILKTSGGK